MRRTPNFGWRVVIVAAALRNRGCSLLRGPFECLEESLTRPCNFSQKATGRCFQQFSAPFLGVKCVHNCYQCVLEGQGRGATGRIARTHTYSMFYRRAHLSLPDVRRWDEGSAVQPPGLSYTAHWEALGCALCLLTSPRSRARARCGVEAFAVFRSAICDSWSIN